MSILKIEQHPEIDETIIEGTRYSNDLLRVFGQYIQDRGPFVVQRRADGCIELRAIERWPEDPL